MDRDEARAAVDALLNAVINWGGVAAHEAERIVEAEWHRQNPSDPITDILNARDALLSQQRYRLRFGGVPRVPGE